MRPVFTWDLGTCSLELGRRTLVMGIVNVTPDSFSDGGEHFTPNVAVVHALKLLDEGADIVDVGGESTRPGAKVGEQSPAVSADEELSRVLPVIAGIKQERPKAIVSIDSYKATVARAAVEAGAEIVNDVSGLQWDPQMPKTVSGLACGVILMHTRGRPDVWPSLPAVPDMVVLVKRELRERADTVVMAGIKRDRIVLDPGQSHTVEFTLGPEQLSFLDRDMHRVVEPGTFKIMVGGNSVEVIETTLNVVAK